MIKPVESAKKQIKHYLEDNPDIIDNPTAYKGDLDTYFTKPLRLAPTYYIDEAGNQASIWPKKFTKKTRHIILNTLLISKSVRDNAMINNSFEDVYAEHGTPVKQCTEDIFNGVDLDIVFKYNKCWFTTKDESRILDCAGSIITEKDIEYAKEHFGKFTGREVNYDSYLGKRANSNGNFFVRIAKLILNGVVFVNFKTGEVLTDEEIYNKIVNDSNILDYNY